MKMERLIGILSILLQREKVTAPELAEQFEVSRRTIQRDIESLCRAGIPIATAQGAGGGKVVCGMYGINLDESMGGNKFEYLIADNYDPAREIPDGFTTRTIPAHTWAVFPCTGRMPQALQGLNQQIFSQWLPTNPDYKIAAGINVELYSAASKFEDGTQDRTTTVRSGSRWKRSNRISGRPGRDARLKFENADLP